VVVFVFVFVFAGTVYCIYVVKLKQEVEKMHCSRSADLGIIRLRKTPNFDMFSQAKV
jgi:hypothetical protein